MKINCTGISVSFSKTLVANCSVVKKNNIAFPCSIYNLTQQEDADYFEKVPNKSDWNGARYLCYLKDDLSQLDDNPDRSVYSLESKTGDCLGYSEILYGTDVNEVLFLETVPTQNFSAREKSSFKYIGETLLSFLVKKSQLQCVNKLELQATVASTTFYKDKCFFRTPKNEMDPLFLRRRYFNKLIKQNEKHTNSSIELVG